MFETITDLAGKLAATGYFIDPVMTQVVFLAAKLQKPLLLEGPAGSGRTMLSLRVSAGSLLGLPAIMANCPYSLTATAEKQAEVYRIGSEDFKEMIHQDSRLCLEVLRILACEVHSARSALGVRLGQTCADNIEN
jgi:CRP-like cAMP-binding protein